jgi:hypothetical protein
MRIIIPVGMSPDKTDSSEPLTENQRTARREIHHNAWTFRAIAEPGKGG